MNIHYNGQIPPAYGGNMKLKKLIISLLITASVIAVLYTSIISLTNRLRPYVFSYTVLGANENPDGTYSPHVYKTDGIYKFLGAAIDFCLGGNPFDGSIISSVSGNFSKDIEKPTIIKKTDTLPLPSDDATVRTINPSGGGIRLNEKISINNETKYKLDTEYLTNGKKPFETTDSPQVLIVHTHTTESYCPTENMNYSFTTEDRTTDTNYNMVRIGREVADELKSRGIGVIHITDLYDYPEYDNSYSRSCKAVEETLEKYPSIKIVLDLHRDAITTEDGEKTKVVTQINGETVAQVMLVVGTDELGLKHDTWETNLKYAINLQHELLKINENFARPINLRTSRFNGHTAPGAVIIEVGAAGNNIEEALASCKYIAEAVSNTI